MSHYIMADRRGRRIRGNSATSAERHKTNEGLRIACRGASWYLQRDGGVPKDAKSCEHDRWISVSKPLTRDEARERMRAMAGG